MLRINSPNVELLNSTPFSWRTTLTPTIILFFLIILADDIETSIIIPSVYKYIHEMPSITPENISLYYGYINASVYIAMILFQPLIGCSVDIFGFKPVIALTTVIAISGNIFYASAHFLQSIRWMWVGRFLSGVGTANSYLYLPYVSRVLSPETQTPVLFVMAIMDFLGTIIGPATNLLTSAANFSIGSFHINDCNAPGLFMAILLLLLLISLVSCFKEPDSYSEHISNNSDKVLQQLLKLENIASCYSQFCYRFSQRCLVMLVDPIAQYAFNWGPFQNSQFFAGLCGYCVIVTFLAYRLSQVVSDVAMIYIGMLISSLACIFNMLFWRYDMSLFVFIVGFALLVTGAPLWKAPNEARFNKFNSRSDSHALLASIFTNIGTMGSIFGAIWVGYSLEDPSTQGPAARETFYGVFVVVFFGLIINFVAALTKRNKNASRENMPLLGFSEDLNPEIRMKHL